MTYNLEKSSGSQVLQNVLPGDGLFLLTTRVYSVSVLFIEIILCCLSLQRKLLMFCAVKLPLDIALLNVAVLICGKNRKYPLFC